MQPQFLPDKTSQSFSVRKKRQVVYVGLEELLFYLVKRWRRHPETFVSLLTNVLHHEVKGVLEKISLGSVKEKHTLLAG